MTKRKAISKKVPALQTMSGMLLNAKLQNKEMKIPKELSKKAKELDKAIEDHIKYDSKGYKGWYEPGAGIVNTYTSQGDIDLDVDSEATVEQVKRFESAKKDWEDAVRPINYWKYACITILLGIVAGMIISTPLFVKLAEVCVQ